MSGSIVFGSQVTVSVGNGAGTKTILLECKSFSSKIDEIVKKNSSLGEAGVGSIDVLDDGGSLSLEANLTDLKALAYMLTQSNHIRGGNTAGRRGKSAYCTVIEEIEFTDGSIAKIFHEGTQLHNLDRSVQGSQSEYSIKIDGTYKSSRVETIAGSEDNIAGKSAVAGIAEYLLNFSKFKDNQATYEGGQFGEVTPKFLDNGKSVN